MMLHHDSQVEKRIAYPGPLPVNEHQPVGLEDIAADQVVVAKRQGFCWQ